MVKIENSQHCLTDVWKVHCGHALLKRDRYMDISLEIQGNNIHDLEGAFKWFTTTEHLSPDNMVVCEKYRILQQWALFIIR